MAKTNFTLTVPQHRALAAIASKPMTRRGIADAAFNGNSVNFVPILGPLTKAKLVKEEKVDVDGIVETIFQITKAGRKLAKDPPPARGKADHKPLPKVGGVIVRTYGDKDHKVTVLEGGKFRYAGKEYGSLTAVAKAVRGSEQEVNGWAFFGLTK